MPCCVAGVQIPGERCCLRCASLGSAAEVDPYHQHLGAEHACSRWDPLRWALLEPGAGEQAPHLASCPNGEQNCCKSLILLPFPPLVSLLSKIDRERGEFLELMGINEGEKLSRMSSLMSLVQSWTHTTSSNSRVCLKPGPFILTIKIQVCPHARQHPDTIQEPG